MRAREPYIVVQDTLVRRLQEKVAKYRRQGYECAGGLIRHPPYFMQAMEWPYEKYTNNDLLGR